MSEDFHLAPEVFFHASSLLDFKNKNFPNIFSIGPFSETVSFESQQCRALNIVWSLSENKFIKQGTTVAVVGGGLSGITAAVALAGYGCKVTIFEKGYCIFPGFQEASHRWLHPTFISWPFRNQRPTTNFPFLNWCSNKCSAVIGEISEEWEQYFIKKNGPIKTRTSINVTFVQCKSDDDKVAVHIEEMNSDGLAIKGESVDEFDLAILATGFGDEKIVTGADNQRYWEKDDLENYVKSFNFENIIVSGVGDGGITEICRLVYKGFEGGNVLLEIIEEIEGNALVLGVVEGVREIENALKRIPPLHDKEADHGILKKINKIENDYRSISKKLNEINFFKEKKVERFLEKKSIYLIGTPINPFYSTTAPIHKLLLAYAMEKGYVKYVQTQRDIKQVPKKHLLVGKEKIRKDYFIARHGVLNPLPIVKILIKEDSENWKKAREELSRELYTRTKELNKYLHKSRIGLPEDFLSNEFFNGYPSLKESPKKFIIEKKRMLDAYLGRRGLIGFDCYPDFTDKRKKPLFFISFARSKENEIKKSRLPEEFFGVLVVPDPISPIDEGHKKKF